MITEKEVAGILPTKLAVERKLMQVPGVTGVDVARKRVKGKETRIPAILVFVAKKGKYAPENEIPPFIEGIPTDVEEAVFAPHVGIAPGTADTDSARYDPCQGGGAIAPARFSNMYGTLGALVTDTLSGNKVWLSNYHVMCVDSTWGNPGVDKNITQPAIDLGGSEAADTIGQVVRGQRGQVVVPFGYDLYIDAAVCSSNGRAASASVRTLGIPNGAANATVNGLVFKYGATSLRTSGKVASTNFTCWISGVEFYYQYRVNPISPGGTPLSQPGDSGAAVFDANSNVVGLVIGGDGATYSVVNPIGQIISALNISIP